MSPREASAHKELPVCFPCNILYGLVCESFLIVLKVIILDMLNVV